MEDHHENPFGDAMRNNYDNLNEDLEFKKPYLPMIIYSLVTIFVLLLFSILYVTIGVATQILSMLWNAAVNSFNKTKTDDNVEAFSYGVAAGIFAVMSIPFAIIVTPFAIVGWVIGTFRQLIY